MSPRAFGAKRNAKLRLIVDQIRVRDFGGNQEKAAEALGVKGPTLHNFLKGDRGAGMKLLDGIVHYTRKSIDQLLGSPSVEFPLFSELSGWETACAEAQRRYPHVPASIFEAVGRWRGPEPPPVVTDTMVGEVAEAVWKASLTRAADGDGLAKVAVEPLRKQR